METLNLHIFVCPGTCRSLTNLLLLSSVADFRAADKAGFEDNSKITYLVALY